MRRTIRGRGARGFATHRHAFREWDHLVVRGDESAIVLTYECACGKRESRVFSSENIWPPGIEGLARGERLTMHTRTDFRACRKLPPVLALRGVA